jgi:hypothetical protein
MFHSLKNSTFARLYTAQTISLLGDALTWVGLALLAVNLAGDRSPTILATALTCRIIAFIVCAPIAGIIADKLGRSRIWLGDDGIWIGDSYRCFNTSQNANISSSSLDDFDRGDLNDIGNDSCRSTISS